MATAELERSAAEKAPGTTSPGLGPEAPEERQGPRVKQGRRRFVDWFGSANAVLAIVLRS